MPKRKAASPAETDETSSNKRAARPNPPIDLDNESTHESPKKSKTKKRKSKSRATPTTKVVQTKDKLLKDEGKGKATKRQKVDLSSDSDTSAPPVAREARSKGSSAKAKSKASTAAWPPLAGGSTSRSNESAPMTTSRTKSQKLPKRPFDETFAVWFAQFASDAEPDKMDGDGIEKLFADMDLSMDGAYPLILAWKVDAKPGTFGEFYKSDFQRAFRPGKIDTSDKLKAFLIQQQELIFGTRGQVKGKVPRSVENGDTQGDAYPVTTDGAFRRFYAFLLPFLRADGAKTLPADTAKAMWSVVLAPRYELARDFVDFAEDQGDQFKAVSNDLWIQLLDFCQTVQPDLTGWSEDDAWPSTIDAFVEWTRARDAASRA